MANGSTVSELRNWLNKPETEAYYTKLQFLWQQSGPIHDRENRPDSNENGLAHVQTVERNIWRLLDEVVDSRSRKQKIKEFEPKELFLLSAAACCHDFDKGIASANPLPDGFEHGTGSGFFTVKYAKTLGLSDDEAEDVCAVVSIHDRKGDAFREALSNLPRKRYTEGKPIDLQRVAVLLKCADILHCDRSRIMEDYIDTDKLEAFERNKYFVRRYTNGWDIDGSRILLQAGLDSREKAEMFRGGFDFMRTQEWPAVADALEQYGFPCELALESSTQKSLENFSSGVVASVGCEPIAPPLQRSVDVNYEVENPDDTGIDRHLSHPQSDQPCITASNEQKNEWAGLIMAQAMENMLRTLNSNEESFRSLRQAILKKIDPGALIGANISLELFQNAMKEDPLKLLTVLLRWLWKQSHLVNIERFREMADVMAVAALDATWISQMKRRLEAHYVKKHCAQIEVIEWTNLQLSEVILTALYNEPAIWAEEQELKLDFLQVEEAGQTLNEKKNGILRDVSNRVSGPKAMQTDDESDIDYDSLKRDLIDTFQQYLVDFKRPYFFLFAESDTEMKSLMEADPELWRFVLRMEKCRLPDGNVFQNIKLFNLLREIFRHLKKISDNTNSGDH